MLLHTAIVVNMENVQRSIVIVVFSFLTTSLHPPHPFLSPIVPPRTPALSNNENKTTKPEVHTPVDWIQYSPPPPPPPPPPTPAPQTKTHQQLKIRFYICILCVCDCGRGNEYIYTNLIKHNYTGIIIYMYMYTSTLSADQTCLMSTETDINFCLFVWFFCLPTRQNCVHDNIINNSRYLSALTTIGPGVSDTLSQPFIPPFSTRHPPDR